jgi:putative phage-type endonuclease
MTESNAKSEAERKWLKQRQSGIGSSEAAAAIGENPWQSALELWARKRELIPPFEGNEKTEWGHRLEPAICKAFAEATGRRIVNLGKRKILRHPHHAWMTATVDRLQYNDGYAHGKGGVLEVKNVGAFQEIHWREGAPRFYWIQLQDQLAVTERQWGSIAALIGGQRFVWQDIDRDDEFIDGVLIPALKRFWTDVLNGTEPPADGSESASKALALLYPERPGEMIALPAAASPWDQQREEAKAAITQWEARKTQATNRLKQMIGTAPGGQLPDGTIYTLTDNGKSRTIRRKTHVG